MADKTKSANPDPTKILSARKKAKLTQSQAAAIVFTTCRVWQQWEAGDRRMHQAFWELFKIKTSP